MQASSNSLQEHSASQSQEPEVFSASIRKQIKEGRCNPDGIIAYIEALEAIARAAQALFKPVLNENHTTVSRLYDALAKVDWMQGDDV